MKNSTYLGDGLYCSFDGYQICLFASNGIQVTNQVFLEPTVLDNFLRTLEKIHGVKIKVTQEKKT